MKPKAPIKNILCHSQLIMPQSKNIVLFLACILTGLTFLAHTLRDIVSGGYGFGFCSHSTQIDISGNDYLRIKEGDATLDPRNPVLLEFIRRRIVTPSLYPVKPYNMQAKDFSQVGQSVLVDELLNQKKNGFHLEVGAADGETMSNSLFFELERNWTGLLIEANPVFFESMLRRNRHAYGINACLSPDNRTRAIKFNPAGLIGGITDRMDRHHSQAIKKRFGTLDEEILIQCYPLASILLALRRTHIDYFSLDIEGPETEILKTIPWAQVTIDVFTIEYRCWDGDAIDREASLRKLESIRRVFMEVGLHDEVTLIPQYTDPDEEGLGLDVLFVRKGL